MCIRDREKKMVEAITSMEEDFAQWYTDVVKKAELCDYASVKGCMVIKPDGYALWENIQNELDKRDVYKRQVLAENMQLSIIFKMIQVICGCPIMRKIRKRSLLWLLGKNGSQMSMQSSV